MQWTVQQKVGKNRPETGQKMAKKWAKLGHFTEA